MADFLPPDPADQKRLDHLLEVGAVFEALRNDAVDRAKYDASIGMNAEKIIAAALTRARDSAMREGYRQGQEAMRERAPILSKYHGQRGFEVERFIADYEAWCALPIEDLKP